MGQYWPDISVMVKYWHQRSTPTIAQFLLVLFGLLSVWYVLILLFTFHSLTSYVGLRVGLHITKLELLLCIKVTVPEFYLVQEILLLVPFSLFPFF